MAKPPSRLGRLARLGSLTGRVSTSLLTERVKGAFRSEEAQRAALDEVQRDNAQQVAKVLGQLKGAAMKVGQQVALAASHLDLPDDISQALSSLNNRAEPIDFATVRATVERELEAPLDALFAEFDPTPLGTASLGQAHLARRHAGEDVVVKVLHPGVEDSVATDLAALKALLIGGRLLRRDRAEIDAGFEEVRERLEEELDYIQEAININAFHALFGDDDRVQIPKVYPELSTERVLTMDRVRGVSLEAFLTTASDEARSRAGQTLAELYYETAFGHQILHADPHPGNYLFQEDGTVGLLDFGCVKRFDEFWIGNYARTALAAIEGDRDAFLDGMRRIDAWHGASERAADAMWEFAEVLASPYRKGVYTIGGAHDSTMERLRPAGLKLMAHREVHLPRDVIFLHRSLGGLYTIARQLVTTLDLGGIASRELRRAIDRADGRVAGS